MYCGKCGDPVEPNEIYCNKCGNYVGEPKNNNQLETKENNSKKIIIGIISGGIIVLIIFIITLLVKNSINKYYFNNDSYDENGKIESATNETTKKSKYSTAIIYDNTYQGVSVKTDNDAYKLIEKDSNDQKDNCPAEIKKIENEIINNYGITAVNLCEMNVDFAKEIANVIKIIYEEYPSARGYMTNLSLANVSMSEGYIAAFMPAFNFATSDSSTTYPWVIKTQILLNTTYFLNTERLEASVKDGSSSGHFPKNATMYSPVAHEFGHYLSFLTMMKNHNLDKILLVDGNNINEFYEVYSDFGKGTFSLEMIESAYNKYKQDTKENISLDDWRKTISKYALAKDNNGNYIYDETIAESFHDVYLNKDKAATASKYIVEELKSKLKE